MSYQVLARKWRPQNFAELIGQEHVLRPLVNALTQQRLHHAYLFTGTRGVGKTTLGRILARCLNCETGISANPCGQCSACNDITQGRFVDLIEVDAASRTKVEDTRELLENVQYAPSRGRFKIYLIDEVHMLSNHSFNALLKTLEEPPPHIKFLLATTDPERLPITILSRCLQFHLKNLSPDLLAKHLQTIVEKENLSAEPEALYALAKSANGSARDALSLLDQAIAYCQGPIDLANVDNMLGTIDKQFIDNLLEGLSKKDGRLILTTIERMAELNTDFNRALETLLECLHQLAIYQLVPDAVSEPQSVTYRFAQQFLAEDIQLFYQIGLLGRRDFSLAPSPRMGLEMILLRMLAFFPGLLTDSTEPKTSSIAAKSPEVKEPTASLADQPPVATPEPMPNQVLKIDANPTWGELLPKLNLAGMTAALASHCVLTKWQPGSIELSLDPKHKPLLNDKIHERLAQALQNHYQQPIKLRINLAQSREPSPAQQAEQQQKQKQEQAQTNLTEDEHVKTIISNFNAKLIRTDPI